MPGSICCSEIDEKPSRIKFVGPVAPSKKRPPDSTSTLRAAADSASVLRLAVLGEPGDDYPVTWIRGHADWQVATDRNTAGRPQHIL